MLLLITFIPRLGLVLMMALITTVISVELELLNQVGNTDFNTVVITTVLLI